MAEAPRPWFSRCGGSAERGQSPLGEGASVTQASRLWPQPNAGEVSAVWQMGGGRGDTGW